MALFLASEIDDREQQAAALAHAAYGFAATAGGEGEARVLAVEVDEMLSSVSDRDQRSSVLAVLALTEVRLRRYAAAVDDKRGWFTHADKLAIHTAMMWDDALRRDSRLLDALEQGSGRGFGRLGLHVP
jgi:hypothetical protein